MGTQPLFVVASFPFSRSFACRIRPYIIPSCPTSTHPPESPRILPNKTHLSHQNLPSFAKGLG